jgi:hypothetical protein
MDARSALTGNPPARGEGGRATNSPFACFIFGGWHSVP